MIARFLNFIQTDIWRMRLRDHSRGKSLFIRFLRIVILAIRSFNENKCKFRASALTFYTLLSIVPVIALMFGIAKGFGLQEKVQAQLLEKMKGQEEVVTKVIDFANSLLANTSGGVVAGVGVAFLLWTIISVLSSIESSFNDIWGVIKPRNLGRKFSDYLSMMLICPILLAIAGSATIFVSSQVQTITEKIPLLKNLGPAFWLLLGLLPYCTLWVAFTFVFSFMPNTKVKLTSALTGGIVAGTVFQIVQWIYINFQIGVAKYGAIYGSFAALPLFLLWLQTSWLIILFGAEVSFAHQNVETYEFEPDCLSASRSFKTLLSLFITQRLVHRFCDGEKPSDASRLSHELEIPIRLVRQLLYDLSESGVLSEAQKGEEKELSYQPATDVDKITVKFVIDRLEQRGTSNIPVLRSAEMDKLSDCLRQFDAILEKLPANVLLKNL
jgi:membrane protein